MADRRVVEPLGPVGRVVVGRQRDVDLLVVDDVGVAERGVVGDLLVAQRVVEGVPCVWEEFS